MLLQIFPQKNWTPGAALVPGHWQVAAPAATATEGEPGEPRGGSVTRAIRWLKVNWGKKTELNYAKLR